MEKEKGNIMDILKAAMLANMVRENAKKGIAVMSLEISVSEIGTSGYAKGNKGLIRDLGLQEEFERFSKEAEGLAEKYGTLISSKVCEKFGLESPSIVPKSILRMADEPTKGEE